MIPKVFVFGLDRAGKTVITNYLTKSTIDQTFRPTLSPASELLVVKELKSRIWDMPGQRNFRQVWFNYVLDSQILVAVVDTADQNRYQEALDEIKKLMNFAENNLKPIPPMVICLHKMDLTESNALISEAKNCFKPLQSYKGKIKMIETTVKKIETLENLRTTIAENLQ